MIDTLQNTNYSLRFTFSDTPTGEFYNLVIGKKPNNDIKTPYILKFISNPNEVENFVQQNYDMKEFNGQIKVYRFNDFFSRNNDTFCPPEYDENGNLIPCSSGNFNATNNNGAGGDPANPTNTNGTPIESEDTTTNDVIIANGSGGGGGNCN